MLKLYDIVKSLQEAQGNLNKQAILMQHKDNELFKEYMRAVYDPGINYYQKKIANPTKGYNLDWCDYEVANVHDFTPVLRYVQKLSNREVTGNAAIKYLDDLNAACSPEGKELLKLLIDRSIGASVGDTMVLKTWPDLYFSVPYQRCSLLDAKAKEKFSKLPLMYVQEKCDGSFLYLVKEAGKGPQAITRAGSRYPREFAEKLAEGVPDGVVLIGELLVYEDVSTHGDYVLLDRKTGNGILNSVLKSGSAETDSLMFNMTVWDFLTPEEFKAGKSNGDYTSRLMKLEEIFADNDIKNADEIETCAVTNLEEAYEIYSNHTADGKEGAVLKTTNFIWKDGTSKDCVKMKIEFEIDLEITGVAEGTGKASGMMGALQLKSSCGKLVTDVGTGFDDATRKQFWQGKDELIGMIVAVKANDIISKRDRDSKSLFLPVFIEERNDKTVADSLEDCERILAAAKGLK